MAEPLPPQPKWVRYYQVERPKVRRLEPVRGEPLVPTEDTVELVTAGVVPWAAAAFQFDQTDRCVCGHVVRAHNEQPERQFCRAHRCQCLRFRFDPKYKLPPAPDPATIRRKQVELAEGTELPAPMAVVDP